MHDVVVIGAGASGIFLSLVLKEKDPLKDILILEKNDKLGKKLLITGNGRCNLGNINDSINNYNSSSSLDYFKKKLELNNYDFLNTMHENLENYYNYLIKFGILIKKESDSSRLYPNSNQSLTVCKSFERALDKRNIKVKYNYNVYNVEKKDGLFIINDDIKCKRLVIATGGMSYPKTGSTGFGYEILKKFNHTITNLYPSLTYLNTDYKYIKDLHGVRIDARVSLSVNEKIESIEYGQIQFAKDYLSGIAVFNLSRNVCKYLSENKNVKIIIDTVPTYKLSELKTYLKNFSTYKVSDAISCVINNKLALVLTKHLKMDKKNINQLTTNELEELCFNLKNMSFNIIDVGGFDVSQVTSGGAILDEFTNNLESKKEKGLYAVGEVLDVDGKCGGYNLSWAFTSALIVALSI